jgi:hypothetical protein
MRRFEEDLRLGGGVEALRAWRREHVRKGSTQYQDDLLEAFSEEMHILTFKYLNTYLPERFLALTRGRLSIPETYLGWELDAQLEVHSSWGEMDLSVSIWLSRPGRNLTLLEGIPLRSSIGSLPTCLDQFLEKEKRAGMQLARTYGLLADCGNRWGDYLEHRNDGNYLLYKNYTRGALKDRLVVSKEQFFNLPYMVDRMAGLR